MPEVSKLINKRGTVFTLRDTIARNEIENLSSIIAPIYDSTVEYEPGDYRIINSQMYRCTESTTGEFDPTKWELASVVNRIEHIEDGGENTTYTLEQSVQDGHVLTFTPSRGAEPTVIRIPETVYNEATQSRSGLLSASDKTKLDGIDTSADVNKIESIKINNDTQPIVDKAVNITIPTKTSDITNDSTYQTLTEVSTAISSAISTAVTDLHLGTAATKNSAAVVVADSADLVTGGAVKNAIDAAVSSLYRPSGNKTVAQLIDSLLVAANVGNVYNITDSGTTNESFNNGSGKPIRAGDNVVVDNVGTNENPVYKFDLLAGFIDLSGYSQIGHTHTVSEITDFPASLPASDVYAWAKAPTKPTYNASEIVDFPTSLPANNTSNTYSPTGITPISGTAVAEALGTLDVETVGGSGKYIQSISETDGKISAVAQTLDASTIGLENVGNFKAVSTVANQELTDTEKSNARANIGAGTSNFSGSYNDLTDKPETFSANDGTLTIQKNGTNIGTFTADQSTASTINITVPTTASDIGAAESNHNHDSDYVAISNFSKIYTSAPSNPTPGTMWVTKL